MTVVDLVNMSFAKIGVTKGIEALTDQTPQAYLGELFYDHRLRLALRRWPWPFATKYLALTLVGGTDTVPVNGDWVFSYRWPTDCLFARRLVPGGGDGRRYSTDFALPFRVGRDDTGLLIYTSQPDAVLEYTMISCGALWADDLFLDWFTWEMATVFAPAHAKSKDHWDKATQMAEGTFLTADAIAAREGEPQRQGDAEWIEAR
jgi:hypothetical protein